MRHRIFVREHLFLELGFMNLIPVIALHMEFSHCQSLPACNSFFFSLSVARLSS